MRIYDYLKFPGKCIVDHTISGEILCKYAEVQDKDILDSIQTVEIKYSLNQRNINIDVYVDEIREYSEIQVIEISLNDTQHVYRITKILINAIKYPVFLIIRKDDKYKLCVANIRNNKVYDWKNVISKPVFTGWFRFNQIDGRISVLLSKLDFNMMNKENFYQLYSNYLSIIFAYRARFISRPKIKALYEYLIGKGNRGEYSTFEKDYMNSCETFVFEEIGRKKFLYCADEIWSVFIRNERLNNSIQGRNISNFEELRNRKMHYDMEYNYESDFSEEYLDELDNVRW